MASFSRRNASLKCAPNHFFGAEPEISAAEATEVRSFIMGGEYYWQKTETLAATKALSLPAL